MSSTVGQYDEKIDAAKAILRGKGGEPEEMLILAKSLAGQKQFGYARRLLFRARNHEGFSGLDQKTKTQIGQKHALYTYKDPDLPKQKRLVDALEILEEIDDVPTTVDQETLGLVGSIHKQRWEMDGQKQHLERSLAYYLQGYQEGVEGDNGYTAINAAYVLDLLASIEVADALKVGIKSEVAQTRFDEAKDIRKKITAHLPQLPAMKGKEWLDNV